MPSGAAAATSSMERTGHGRQRERHSGRGRRPGRRALAVGVRQGRGPPSARSRRASRRRAPRRVVAGPSRDIHEDPRSESAPTPGRLVVRERDLVPGTPRDVVERSRGHGGPGERFELGEVHDRVQVDVHARILAARYAPEVARRMTFVIAVVVVLLTSSGCAGTGTGGRDVEDRLLAAAATGDLDAIAAAVAGGCGRRRARRDAAGPPLLVATEARQTDAVRALLDAGADVDLQDDKLDNPFLYAGAEGLLDILRLANEAGADPAITNRYGGIALIPASERGHVETVRYLLDRVGRGRGPRESAGLDRAAGGDPAVRRRAGATRPSSRCSSRPGRTPISPTRTVSGRSPMPERVARPEIAALLVEAGATDARRHAGSSREALDAASRRVAAEASAAARGRSRPLTPGAAAASDHDEPD